MFPRTFLSLRVAALIATPAFALVHLGPRATDTFADAPDATGWTPKPTPAPLLSGSLSELKNRKRQDTVQALPETCGWYSADPSEPFSCDPGNACAFNTQNSYFGCCSTDASGYFISSDCAYIATPSAGCYDYTQASLCTGQCYYSNMICASTAPYCISALLFLQDSEVLTHYACFTESNIRVLSVAPTASATATTTSITSTVTPGSTHTGTSSTTTTTSPPSSSSSSVTPGPQPVEQKSNHTGAIAGGVVGGLVLIAAAIVGAIFFLRKKKKEQRKSIMPEISQM